LRVLGPLRTSQRDLDPALVSLEETHSSLHELDMYPTAIRVPAYIQYSHERWKRVETSILLVRQSSA
jgi:hypothetical protein